MIEFGHDKDSGYWLRAEMLVEQPLETVFEFFADAKQLERITPPILNFKILTPMPVEMKACLLYTSPSPRDKRQSRMPSSA